MSDLEVNIPLRLVRLISASLPVGAFSYSRGLEHAVNAGWIKNTQDLESWLFGTLDQSFAPMDGALFLRMMRALDAGRFEDFNSLDRLLSAGRESNEFLLEDRRMATALLTLLGELEVPNALNSDVFCQTFTGAFALASNDMKVTPESSLHGLIWSICDAQVSAAIRLGVMGQTDGQRLLAKSPEAIRRAAKIAQSTPDDEIGNLSFMLAVGSSLHETQYSRLFRS